VPNFVNNFLGGFGVTVQSNAHGKGYTLDGVNINGLTVTGPANRGMTLFGSQANDHITGGAQPDTIIGGRGADVLTGGATPAGVDPSDTFVFHRHSGNDVITDFAGDDTINIASYLHHGANVTVTDGVNGAVIDMGGGNSITLLGVPASDLLQTPTGFQHAHLLVG
jgi:Ca2+-binding RTX toxin-like protein